MSWVQDLAEIVLKKPRMEDNIQTINGRKLSDILPPNSETPGLVQGLMRQQTNQPPVSNSPVNSTPQSSGMSPLSAWLQGSVNTNQSVSQPMNSSVNQGSPWLQKLAATVGADPPKSYPQIAPDTSINPPPASRNDGLSDVQQALAPNTIGGIPLPSAPTEDATTIAPDKQLSPLETLRRQVLEINKEQPTNKDHGWKGAFKEIAQNALAGAGQAAKANPNAGFAELLGGVLGTAGAGGVDRTLNERRNQQQRLGKALQDYGVQKQFEDDQLARKMKQTQIDNTNFDNDTQRQLNQDRIKNQQDETNRKRAKDQSDAEAKEQDRIHKQAQLVAGIVNRLPSFDPDDPKNAAIVKQMQQVGIPVFKKDGSKDIRYFQDEDTGAWFTTIADKATGRSETHAVLKKDGNPLVTTPRVKVQGENAATVAGINQQGAKERTEITQAGANQRLTTSLQNRNDQQKQKLAGDTLTRWQQNFVKVNGAMPTQKQIDAARQSINSSIFGNQE